MSFQLPRLFIDYTYSNNLQDRFPNHTAPSSRLSLWSNNSICSFIAWSMSNRVATDVCLVSYNDQTCLARGCFRWQVCYFVARRRIAPTDRKDMFNRCQCKIQDFLLGKVHSWLRIISLVMDCEFLIYLITGRPIWQTWTNPPEKSNQIWPKKCMGWARACFFDPGKNSGWARSAILVRMPAR